MNHKSKEKKKLDPIALKKFYSMFLLIVPSILLVVVSEIDNIFIRILAQLLLLVLQLVVIKGLLDDYYSEDNQ